MSKFVLCILVFLISFSGYAQKRQKKEQMQSSGEVTKYAGAVVNFNNITGALLEISLRNRSGSVSKSTIVLVGGYASRYVGFEDDLTGQTKKEWVHGVGGGVVLNNYIRNLKEGMFWSIGVAGNLYFKHSDQPEKFSNQLKSFSVFGQFGYKMRLEEKIFLQPYVGVGLMGSPFRSSSSSDINGGYLMIGSALNFRI